MEFVLIFLYILEQICYLFYTKKIYEKDWKYLDKIKQ